MAKSDLDLLLDDIARINPYYTNFLGSHMPGMAGMSATSIGASNASVEVIVNLKRDASLFATLVTAQQRSQNQLTSVMQRIEGSLMTLSVLGRLADDYRDSILNRMQDIAQTQKI